MTVLRQRLTSADDRSIAAQLVTAGGYVAAVLLLTGVALYGTIPIQHLFNHGALPTAAVSRVMLGASYATGFVVAPLAFGLMIVAVSLLGLRHGTLPRWLALAGFPLAAIQLASLLFFPAWLVVLWSLATSAALTIRRIHPAVLEPHSAAVLT